MGYCPECHHLVSNKDGCATHRWAKKNRLLSRLPDPPCEVHHPREHNYVQSANGSPRAKLLLKEALDKAGKAAEKEERKARKNPYGKNRR